MARTPRAPSRLVLVLLLSALTLTTAAPTPTPNTAPNTAPPQSSCLGPNLLQNPSFDSPHLSPWLPLAVSAWSPSRGILLSPRAAHSGSGVYYAHCLSTIPASLALSQAGVAVQAGREVECFAWVRGRRGDGGVTAVEVFLDGVSCGRGEVRGGEEGWARVGGRVRVEGEGEGEGRTVGVVVASEGAGDGGWEVWVDDVGVVGC
ncbi:hypothetical protein B5807_08545 [Epicoccum nigrum]|uniref:CBM-cenC domain-containing protein n=1 Tax=Epicoccum nigrum TaxID=105696 RepID=A0A1Y2LSG8_EPING|nr:hypothetical protein B5807_08545 [Epicoccum nigrum]